MTYAHLSRAAAESQRYNHQSQNTFNQIQNSLMTKEIHDQGMLHNVCQRGCLKREINLAETSFCWAFAISTMIRHSLNCFQTYSYSVFE